MKMMIHVMFAVLLMSMGCASSPSRYDEARELYKQGPKKGPEIISLLRAHIHDNPKDQKAIRLLGITLYGIKKPAEALPVFEQAIDIATENDTIAPSILMLKARALYDLNRKYECKRILEIYWAFWQDDGELKKSYEWYYPKVKDTKEPANGEQKNPPDKK